MATIDVTGFEPKELTEREKAIMALTIRLDFQDQYMQQLTASHDKETKISNEQIIDIFPEEQKLVAEKIEELWDEAVILKRDVEKLRNITDSVQSEPFSKWFFINADRFTQTRRLKEVYQNLKRLRQQKIIYEKKQIESLFKFITWDTKEEKRRFNIDAMFARENLLIDILIFYGFTLKRCGGSSYRTLCPFHEEQTPSFTIYSDNWFHCFGCSKHGSFITYLMEKKNFDFKQALEEANRFL